MKKTKKPLTNTQEEISKERKQKNYVRKINIG